MVEKPGECYDAIADDYARTLESRPWNVCYERPAMLSLLPELHGQKVLDVGCGPGWYAEHLAKQGAVVTAFDRNTKFVELARERLGKLATVFQADLSEPLTMLEDEEFDLIVCPLVLHYLKDWQPSLQEFARVLKNDGRLVFSTHHPMLDWQSLKAHNYFEIEYIEDTWDVGKVQFYRRPFSRIITDLVASGFQIEQILEPQPDECFRKLDDLNYDYLKSNPGFLLLKVRKSSREIEN